MSANHSSKLKLGKKSCHFNETFLQSQSDGTLQDVIPFKNLQMEPCKYFQYHCMLRKFYKPMNLLIPDSDVGPENLYLA